MLDNRTTAEPVVDEKAAELAKDFSYDGYQVARRELFAHGREPAVTIRKDSISFNTACIGGLEDAVYIQVLINPDKKHMVIRKCGENDKDALRWCLDKPDGRRSRKVTSKIFSAMLYDLLGWDAGCRYKVLGHKIAFENEQIYVFDLAEIEIFHEKQKIEAAVTNMSLEERETAIAKALSKASRRAYFQAAWESAFGVSVEEHKQAFNIRTVDGYTAFDFGNRPQAANL